MYRLIKSKNPEGYSVHKILKIDKGETYVEAEPLLKAETVKKLHTLTKELNMALDKPSLNKSDIVLVHKTLWNENDIPFYDDIADEVLEQEFMNEHTFSDEDKAHTRW